VAQLDRHRAEHTKVDPEVAVSQHDGITVPAPRTERSMPAKPGRQGGRLSWQVVTSLLEHGGIATAYQPLVDVRRHRIIGWEALLRAQHDDYGALSPVAVVEAAEWHGLLDLLTRRIVEDARATMAAARELVDEPLTIHLNLELSQLGGDPPLLAWLAGLTWPDGVQAVVEITERGTDEWLPEYEQGAATLAAGGLSLAIDDCGAGASRLGFLSCHPWQVVKLDRQLVAGPGGERRAVVLRHLVELLAELGTVSVAEGVETVEQLRRLRELGVDQAQGYLLGMPVPGPVMLAELARNGLTLAPMA
jgi:EAL domain-containing protein (putative c-di-GMP-specific phosphodiesterase class I)